MAKPVLDDELWELIEPVLPDITKPKGGRPPLDNRRVLTGIVFVLKTGKYLPQELGSHDLLASAALVWKSAFCFRVAR